MMTLCYQRIFSFKKEQKNRTTNYVRLVQAKIIFNNYENECERTHLHAMYVYVRTYMYAVITEVVVYL